VSGRTARNRRRTGDRHEVQQEPTAEVLEQACDVALAYGRTVILRRQGVVVIPDAVLLELAANGLDVPNEGALVSEDIVTRRSCRLYRATPQQIQQIVAEAHDVIRLTDAA
jgi:hypothetical protein